jgi:hypothetical protein
MADNVIYENTIDHGRFGIRVVGTSHGSYTGMLAVWVVEPYKTLLSMTVQLNYAPGNDPDPNDIADWQTLAVRTIDKWRARNDEDIQIS